MSGIIDIFKRAFRKLIIYPFKYKKGKDYKAEQYWKDRFERHGSVLKAVGHEGLSEEENRKDYEAAADLVLGILEKEGRDKKNIKVLEIGSGTGFYTRKLRAAGFENLTSVDITNHFFSELRKELPQITFIQKDISSESLEESYDIILMIDVVQHIVNPNKFRFAMGNISDHLNKNGTFLISGLKGNNGGKQLFYVQSWKQDEISAALDLHLKEEFPFRRGTKLLAYEKE